jgi:chromosome segregation ATPase
MKKFQIIACIFFILSVGGSAYAQSSADDVSAPASYNSILQAENKELRKELATLKKQLWTAQNTTATSNRDVTTLTQEVADYKAQIANLQAQLTNAQNTNSNNTQLQTDYNNLARLYAAVVYENSKLKAQNSNNSKEESKTSSSDSQNNDAENAAPKKVAKKSKIVEDTYLGTDVQGRKIYVTPFGERYYINSQGDRRVIKGSQ